MRRDRAYFVGVHRLLGDNPGVSQVRINPIAASVAVEHDGDLSSIQECATREGLFVMAFDRARGLPRQPLEIDSPPPAMPANPSRRWLRIARHNASNSAIEKIVNAYACYRTMGDPPMALFLLGWGAFQMARGDVFSSALAVLDHTLNPLR
jgi:hypothetical protein